MIQITKVLLKKPRKTATNKSKSCPIPIENSVQLTAKPKTACPTVKPNKQQPQYIGNHTLNSIPGNTFLIKPLDSDSNLSFTNNPVKIAQGLAKEPFCKLNSEQEECQN